jgi:hypothetical protein
MRLNFQETLRLVLHNTFKGEDPELTPEVQDPYQRHPGLFNKVPSRTDRNKLETLLDNDFEIEAGQPGNNAHPYPTAVTHTTHDPVVSQVWFHQQVGTCFLSSWLSLVGEVMRGIGTGWG